MPSVDVRAGNTTDVADYTLYDILIIIKFNQHRTMDFKISKRFSDFVQLQHDLTSQKLQSIPSLPSRYTSFFKSRDKIVEERKAALVHFTSQILNETMLRENRMVLEFYNLPKSAIVELSIISKPQKDYKAVDSTVKVDKIESAQHWMDVFKLVKSLLQDARSKLFSSSNVVEIRKSLKSAETNLNLLNNFLNTTKELGAGEIRRRREMIVSMEKDLKDLNIMLSTMKFNDTLAVNKASNSETKTSLFNPQGSGSGSRRTFGKPAGETSETKKHDNKGLLQVQQQQMQSQDEDLLALKDIIVRQKQIGLQVNEELTIQNELLGGLSHQVDNSSSKLNTAKSKVKRFL